MRKNCFKLIALVFLVQLGLPGATRPAAAQAEKAPYLAMAPVEEYLIADENTEIALARSAAPASISDGAEVMVRPCPNGRNLQRLALEMLSLRESNDMARRRYVAFES